MFVRYAIKPFVLHVALFALSLYLLGFPTQPVYAQVNPNDPTFCYTVADNGGVQDPDVLIRIDRSTGMSTAVIGATGTLNVEAMAFVPGGATLYVVETNQLGTLTISTGAFTPIGTPLGIGNGAIGLQLITNIDGLTYHSTENLLYATVRRIGGLDLLIRIDPATGALVPFAPGIDYVVITVTGSPNNYVGIDDLSFDPVTDRLYAISSRADENELVTINPTTGVATYIANFSLRDEVEGLSFFNDGELYASSGGKLGSASNRLYRVDKTNGVLTDLGSISIGGNTDFESIGCLTAAAFLAVEKQTNGIDADLPTGPHIIVGDPVVWSYTLRNTGVVTTDQINLTDDRLALGAITCPAFPQPNHGLNPGEAILCTATGVATAGQYTNTATVTGIGYLPTGDAAALQSSDRSHYLGVQPDLVINKDDGGSSTKPGNTLIYTLVYSNAGTIGATGVTITEHVPAYTTFNPAGSSVGWGCTPSNAAGSICTLTLGSVAAGQRSSINFAVTLIDSFPISVNFVTNTATISDDGMNGVDPNLANNQSTATTPVIAAPELEADKIAQWQDIGQIGGIDPGELITYTIVVRNIGNQDVINVPVVDTPDANSTLVVGTVNFTSGAGIVTTGNNLGDSTIAVLITSIPGGSEVRFVYQATINTPLPIGVDRIINRALVSNTIPLSTTVPAVAKPDLAITKSDGGVSTTAGDAVVYSLSYRNNGTRNATGIVIKEVVPENTAFAAAASAPTVWSCPDGSPAGTLCTTTIGALRTGGSGSVRFAVRVNSPLPAGIEQVENLVRISDDGSNGDDPTPQNNLASDSTPVNAAPDLILSKDDGNATTMPGATVVYTLTYTNDGNQDATGVQITDLIPTYTSFNAAGSTPGWLCTPTQQAGSACTIRIGSLAAGETSSVRFAVQVDNSVPAAVVQIANQAQISDDGRNGVDPAPQSNAAADTTPVIAAPDLIIAKDDNGVAVLPGGLVVYRLDYTNAGNQDATGVILSEVVPTNSTFVPANSTAGWFCSPNISAGSTCTLVVGAVAVGQNGSANFAVTALNGPLPAGLDAINNIAQIADDGSNGPDPVLENNQATDTTPLDAAPNLIVEKTADTVIARPDDTIKYTLVYTNIGNQDATGVVLREVVPEWTTFTVADSTPGWTCAIDPTTARTVCTFAIGFLQAGATGTLHPIFAVTVVNAVPIEIDQIVNVVLIGDDGTNGAPPTGTHSDTVTTPLIQPTNLEPAQEPGLPEAQTRSALFLPLVVR